MKSKLFVVTLAIIAMVAGVSCKKNDPAVYGTATVTIREAGDGGCFMVVNDSTELHPSNMRYPSSDYSELRALISYQDNGAATPGHGFKYARDVAVVAYQPMITKSVVESQGQTVDDQTYGTEPLGLYLQPTFPCTVIEDGYLNLSFAFEQFIPEMHYINVVYNVDGDPYTLEVHHKLGEGDANTSNGLYNGIMSFSLQDLPDTNGETKTITLKWNSIKTGEKEELKLDYKTRTDWPSSQYSSQIN